MSINTRRLVVEHGGFVYDSDADNDWICRRIDIARYWLATHPPPAA